MEPRLNQNGPTLIVLAEHKEPVYAKTGLTLITSKMRRPPPEILDPRIHHANLLNSILAKIEANNAGADDALMLDTRSFVAATNATHVFLVRNGELATSRATAFPEGLTRATDREICAANTIPPNFSLQNGSRTKQVPRFLPTILRDLSHVGESVGDRFRNRRPGPSAGQGISLE